MGPDTSTSYAAPTGPARPGKLLAELVIVCSLVCGVVALARLRAGSGAAGIIASVWLASAVVPVVWRKAGSERLGFPPSSWLRSALLGATAVLATGAGVWIALAAWDDLRDLLPAAAVPETGRLAWVLFHLVLVSIPEELFFRGYLQGTLTALLARGPQSARRARYLAAAASAVLFALAHVLFFRSAVMSAVVVPALVMGWLRMRSGGVVAPILFHWLVNLAYPCILAWAPSGPAGPLQ